MYSQDRDQLRLFYCEVWHKFVNQMPLEPLEKQIADIITEHPEYHGLLSAPEKAKDQDFLPESGQSNPFLHIALHLSLIEQITTNQPAGITLLYNKLVQRRQDRHVAEHEIMNCLTQIIWEVQHDNKPYNEKKYLRLIRKLMQ